jgi:hypothetical protein
MGRVVGRLIFVMLHSISAAAANTAEVTATLAVKSARNA